MVVQHGNEFKAIPLSEDHKPSLESEKQRILKSGGRIETQKGGGIILLLLPIKTYLSYIYKYNNFVSKWIIIKKVYIFPYT